VSTRPKIDKDEARDIQVELKMNPGLDFASDRRTFSRLLRVATVIAMIGVGASSAQAQVATGQLAQQPALGQPAPPPNPLAGVEILVTPYLWGSW
jgi:hypothetical protein